MLNWFLFAFELDCDGQGDVEEKGVSGHNWHDGYFDRMLFDALCPSSKADFLKMSRSNQTLSGLNLLYVILPLLEE